MDFTKVFFPGWLLLLMGGCSMQPRHALLTQPSAACLHEVKVQVKSLAETENVRLSDDLFQKNSLLVLTNRPRTFQAAENRMAGVIGSEKMVRLFHEGGQCLIGLQDESGKIVKKIVLKKCRCRDEAR